MLGGKEERAIPDMCPLETEDPTFAFRYNSIQSIWIKQ